MRLARAVPFLAVIAALSAGAGLLYSFLSGGIPLAGLIYGLSIGLVVMSFERGFLLGGVQARMKRWPSLVYIPVLEAAFIVLICVGFLIGGLISWTSHLTNDSFVDAVVPTVHALVFAIAISILLVFITRVRDLLGHAVFTNFIIGRYHRPVEEERVFLFLDLAGSTAYARANGDLRAQEFLGAIFTAMAEPVRLHGGAIDDYVGDMALVTWPMSRGVTKGACIRCVFTILDEIARDAPSWQRRFGQVPKFHAALHGGPVVTAEVGVDRHKISYFGDVVNTTARLERLSRDLAVPVVISADLLGRVGPLPAHVQARSVGVHALTGRDQRLEVFGLERIEMGNVLPLQSAGRTGRRPAARS